MSGVKVPLLEILPPVLLGVAARLPSWLRRVASRLSRAPSGLRLPGLSKAAAAPPLLGGVG